MNQQSTDPITATINVFITQFRSLGGVFPIGAPMNLASPCPNVTVVDGSIVVTGTVPVTLIFKLSDPTYLFAGVSFNTKGQTPDVGATEFPTITINRNPANGLPGNCIAIMDANLPQNIGKDYSYVLLVQKTTTAEIGLIDPGIRNEP